jgi:hypothetical protein
MVTNSLFKVPTTLDLKIQLFTTRVPTPQVAIRTNNSPRELIKLTENLSNSHRIMDMVSLKLSPQELIKLTEKPLTSNLYNKKRSLVWPLSSEEGTRHLFNKTMPC